MLSEITKHPCEPNIIVFNNCTTESRANIWPVKYIFMFFLFTLFVVAEEESWFLCLKGVITVVWLSVFCVFSSHCHGFVNGL